MQQDTLHPGIPLFCVEFYGTVDPGELIAAVDVPAGRAQEYTVKIGKLLCAIRKRNSVNALILNSRGEAVERMMVYR